MELSAYEFLLQPTGSVWLRTVAG